MTAQNRRWQPAGTGELGDRIRAFDWAATALGAMETWPQSLRTAVDLMLQSAQPTYVGWGPDFLSLYNDSYIPLLGARHPDALGKPCRDVWPEIWDQYEPIAEAVLGGEACHFVDQPVPLQGRPDRPMSWFTFSWTPLRGDDGEFNGLFCATTETTDRVLAERRQKEALLESDNRYRQLFNKIDQGFCVIEMIFDEASRPVDYRFLEVNAAFERQTGLANAVGRTMRSFEPEHEEHWFRIYGRIALTGRPERFEHAAEKLGHFYEVYAFRVGAPKERRVGILFNDIIERKRSEEQQNLLIAELDHRVKNVLAVVQSIARQSLGRNAEAGSDAADRFVGRISALAQSHSLLAASRWEGAGFRDLFESAVVPYRCRLAGHICADGPDLQVTPKAAQTLTLALHELTTNAAKYGALSTPEGRVTAGWELHGAGDGGRLIFHWREQDGPPVDGPPTRRGFGSRLIERSLAFELGGEVTIDFARDGLSAVFDLPLDNLLAGNPRHGSTSRTASTPSSGSPRILEGMKILLVEDELLIAYEMADALRAAGCSVAGPTPTLGGALRAAEAEELDAAVLDINLNGEFVWPAARALRARGIPFVFATGYSAALQPPPELAEAPRFEKPIQPQRLLLALAALVAT